MRLLIILVTALSFSLAGATVHAEDAIDCANAVTTADLNACGEKSLDAADAALNAAYKIALSKIAAGEDVPPRDPKSWTGKLKASQRAWLAFRDADCQDLVALENGGGTMTAGEILGCLTELTEARTKVLMARYGER